MPTKQQVLKELNTSIATLQTSLKEAHKADVLTSGLYAASLHLLDELSSRTKVQYPNFPLGQTPEISTGAGHTSRRAYNRAKTVVTCNVCGNVTRFRRHVFNYCYNARPFNKNCPGTYAEVAVVYHKLASV